MLCCRKMHLDCKHRNIISANIKTCSEKRILLGSSNELISTNIHILLLAMLPILPETTFVTSTQIVNFLTIIHTIIYDGHRWLLLYDITSIKDTIITGIVLQST